MKDLFIVPNFTVISPAARLRGQAFPHKDGDDLPVTKSQKTGSTFAQSNINLCNKEKIKFQKLEDINASWNCK